MDSEWAYLCDFKVSMKDGEGKTMMFFADINCPHIDVSWVWRERAEAATAALAAVDQAWRERAVAAGADKVPARGTYASQPWNPWGAAVETEADAAAEANNNAKAREYFKCLAADREREADAATEQRVAAREQPMHTEPAPATTSGSDGGPTEDDEDEATGESRGGAYLSFSEGSPHANHNLSSISFYFMCPLFSHLMLPSPLPPPPTLPRR